MWTQVPKPNTRNYTNTNVQGKEQYDQPDLTYDSAITYYDGINPNQWTDIAKPNEGFGLLEWDQMTMQWQDADDIWDGSSTWTKVSKPV